MSPGKSQKRKSMISTPSCLTSDRTSSGVRLVKAKVGSPFYVMSWWQRRFGTTAAAHGGRPV